MEQRCAVDEKDHLGGVKVSNKSSNAGIANNSDNAIKAMKDMIQ